MKLRTLLALLFGSYLRFGVVPDEGGGAAVVEDEPEDEPEEAPGDTAAEVDEAPPADDGEVVITLGDEPASEDDEEEAIAAALGEGNPSNAAFAKLRKHKQDLKRQTAAQAARIRELEAQTAARNAPVEIEVGEEPDPSKYEMWEPEQATKFKADLLAWTKRKADADAVQQKRADAQKEELQRWQSRLQAVESASSSLKVADRAEAEATFEGLFSTVQRGIIIGGPDDAKTSAMLRYALGKAPAKAKELAAITDPVKFTYKVAQLELQLKATPRKPAPPPESVVRSSAGAASAVDDQGEKLREEARRTGDYTKVAQFNRERAARKRA